MQVNDGYIIVGYTGAWYDHPPGYTNYTGFILKTNLTGDMQWKKTYGREEGGDAFGYSVVKANGGGYLLVGIKAPPHPTGDGIYEQYFWLVKTDEEGNAQWSKTYGKLSQNILYSAIQTQDGGYLLAGTTTSNGVESSAWLVKVDADGNAAWNKTYGENYYSRANSIVESDDGGYAFAGQSKGDFWLVKIDSEGNVEWEKTYHGEVADMAYTLVQSRDGGYLLAGVTSFAMDDMDGWLVKTNQEGDMQWTKRYGGPIEDALVTAIQTSDGGYASGGDFIVKVDANGNKEWNITYGNGTARALTQSADGGLVFTGQKREDTFRSSVWLVKIAPQSSLPFANIPFEVVASVSAVFIGLGIVLLVLALRKLLFKKG
jgi:uncharacterized lipoprotein YmbA